jgi:hypothetical protein
MLLELWALIVGQLAVNRENDDFLRRFALHGVSLPRLPQKIAAALEL